MTGVYDVTEALDDLLQSVIINRAQTGSYIKGKWTVGATVPEGALAVPIPMTQNEINNLVLEGYHGRKLIQFYFKDTYVVNMSINPTTVADTIEYEGETFIPLKKDSWEFQGGYFLVYAERNI